MNIYVDNSATTKINDKVLNKIIEIESNIFGNPSSLHTFGQIAKEHLEKARREISEEFGCEPRELIFTSGGSEADNLAILGILEDSLKKGKNHIISTKIEHHAVLHTLEVAKKRGFDVTLINVDSNGIVKLEELENAINEKTCLVSCMFVNNEIGTIQPIKEIGQICKNKGVIFHTDAVQAVGHIKINVKELNIDMLSISAHKFNGPKGVGLLYVNKKIKLNPIINGGAQEMRKRAGTENVSGIVGMALALKIANSDIENKENSIKIKREKIIDGLLEIPNSFLNGDRNIRVAGNSNICFEGIEGEALLLMLDDKGIYASSGSACTSGDLEPSHVLLAIGRPHEVAHGSLRITIDDDLTEDQIEYIIKSIKEVVSELREMSPLWKEIKERGINNAI